MFDENVKQNKSELLALSKKIAPLYKNSEYNALNTVLKEAQGDLGGRLFVLDNYGKVQFDTQNALNGEQYLTDEVYNVLVRGQPMDFGVHNSISNEEQDIRNLFFTYKKDSPFVSLGATGFQYKDNLLGVLLLSLPVNDMMQGLFELKNQMFLIFLLVSLAALICSLVFSTILTRPIYDMTKIIQKMSKGTFSARVKVRGSGEIKRMAETFNMMSEKLEMLDTSRNQFVSNASHELKTPLATMKIMIESLIYQPDMDKSLRIEFMTDIDKEIDRLSAIVSDLLTLVRIDSNSVKLNRENLSIAALVKETTHRLYTMSKKKGQNIHLTLSDPCDMYADKSKLTQVIYNLVENAVKYTQPGGEITVLLYRVGHNALLKVSDNGPGIPKEALTHIFDRFYRFDKARSRESGGTGLGLSIVHQLVVLHGGIITAESKENQGTTFTVELPLHEG